METFILLALGFVVGWKLSELFHVMSFKKILEDLNVKETDLRRLHSKLATELDDSVKEAEPQDKVVVEIKIEQHQGLLYAFEVEKDSFVAQGRDGDELLERILAKYPVNYRVICDKSNGGEFINEAVQKMAQRNG